MIRTEIPKPKEPMTFWEACKANSVDGCDICDADWDWGIYLGIPEAKSLKECEDDYDRFCLLLALNLECEKFQSDWYSVCKVSAFIEQHRKAFDRFCEEENRVGYRPSDYPEPLKADEDHGYCEVYMGTMENLIAGNYCDSDYEKLVSYILGEA